ncbi:MAG: ATP-binding protein [Candidatus Magasanikbacteria bacterium]
MNSVQFIKRDLLEELKDHLSEKEMSLIVGPRQAGKTTIMRKVQSHLEKNGQNTLFYDLDKQPELFETQEEFLQNLKLDANKQRTFVFLDEIQRKKNAGLFLKGIYDRDLDYKFIVSGSGSLELKSDVHESMAGRKLVFELSTISFPEFVNFKTDYQYESQLDQFFRLRKEKARLFLKEYLNFGGYPRVVQKQTREQKRRMIGEIVDSYLRKDITDLLGVRKTDKFSKLIKIVSDQVGQPMNYSKLARDLQIDQKTIKNYIYYAEETFVVDRVRPFFRNRKKELTKAPVPYFFDIGFRNYELGQFGNLRTSSEFGIAFENLVYNQLKSKTRFSAYEVKYWRTKNQTEVDFIVTSSQRRAVPIEVKYKNLKETKIPRSFRSFLKKYEPEKAYIVNLSLNETKEIEDVEVEFISIFNFLGKLIVS